MVDGVRASGGTADFVRTDVSSPADVEHLIREVENRHRHVDILVSNAGMLANGTASGTK